MNSEQFSLSRAFSEIKSWRQTFTWLWGSGKKNFFTKIREFLDKFSSEFYITILKLLFISI